MSSADFVEPLVDVAGFVGEVAGSDDMDEDEDEALIVLDVLDFLRPRMCLISWAAKISRS